MRYLLFFLCIAAISCKQNQPEQQPAANMASADLTNLADRYYRERLTFYPFEATIQGLDGMNDQMPIDISEEFRVRLGAFYTGIQTDLAKIAPDSLSENDRITYDILKWESDLQLEGLKFPDHLLPINQFWGVPLTMGQYGSGSGPQPFKTAKDYMDWQKRLTSFAAWCDTAVVKMRTGLTQGYVLPKSLIVKVIPQIKDMVVSDPTQSLFYEPVKNFPAGLAEADQKVLAESYRKTIGETVVPATRRLLDFLEKEYLPKGRTSSGYSDIPGGRGRYDYLIKQWTTTTMTADAIFDLGEKEVARIRTEMEKVKNEVGFKGDLKAFFQFINSDKKFTPFKDAGEVTKYYASMEATMQPQLKLLFDMTPKTKFEVRRTEAFREASASAEYVQGTPNGSRPGVFYVPVPNAAKYNVVGAEALFLHEAIPGHHYQFSLQQENTSLPTFRRFAWYGAYGEGWALYTESLGKELGLYTDPYQYFGMLSSEMHRAIRLVVDVGLHVKGWTREQAIQYSKDNEAEPEESIIAEIERYMAIPGQALSYKVGQLKILELRAKAEQELGGKFDPRQFHNQMLDAGCLPLKVLEDKINRWIAEMKK